MATVAAIRLSQWPIPTRLFASQWVNIYAHVWRRQFIPLLSITFPSISLNLPTLDDIWGSILRAVPKKKPSHSRRRHRRMAGKALPEVTGLCKCPGCGETKRTHRLCQHCLQDMRQIWRQDDAEPGQQKT
ncbi:hypothetical protein CDD82_29 [Ophiocordyceps australis]|uniref:Large ribosomal subunit protein bL32m n=1 Tax=Ophiocordyceps australis TaxID=1399860 RepID=A0A2C5Z0G5_9HYPO|nr:hypothetical protein CDD82_29 [Ophiocordyceps australis]